MKKTIYIILIVAVTVFCVIFGTVRFVGGFSGLSLNNPFKTVDSEKSNIVSGQEILLENFNKIDIDANVMGITIVPGDGSKAKVTFSKQELIPEISVRDGVVKVRQHLHGNLARGNFKSELVITVPENVELEYLKARLNVGSIDVENLVAYSLNLETNVGSVNMDRVNFLEMEGSVDVGSIEVRVNDNIDDYKIDAVAEMGSVDVGHESKNKRFSQSGTNGKSIEVRANLGSIKLR